MSGLSPKSSLYRAIKQIKRPRRGVGPKIKRSKNAGCESDEVHAHLPSENQKVQLTYPVSKAENQCRTMPNWVEG